MSVPAGQAPAIAVFLLVAVAALVGSAGAGIRARRVRGRGERLLAVEREPRRRWAPLAARAGVWAAPAGAVITCWVLVEGIPGLALGLAAAFGVRRWRRTRPGGAAADPAVERELPLAADLLAACLTAGAGPREAAEAVGDCLGGRVGAGLTQAAAELRLGGEPARAWDSFARLPGAAELARCLERADCAGAPAAEPVSRLARRLRDTRARASAARGRRAQVLVTAPVGLCFLPAFLSVGVAPVVIGLAGGLLHGN